MTKPITILHTRVVAGAGGGPDKTILRSAAALDHTRYNAVAAYLHPAGDSGIETLRASASRHEMQMHTIPERGPIDLRALSLLLDLCKRLHVDIWHAHDYKTDILGRILRRYHRMKLVTTMHGFTGETVRTRLYAYLSNYAMRGYDKVIAVSPLLIRHAAEHGVHPDRLRYVPNAIDLNEYARRQTREQAKKALGLSQGEHAVGIVSRFSVEKGVDRGLRAFAKLHELRPQSRLHLIGDGPKSAELKQLAESLGVQNAVRWWGWQRDTRSILEALDTLLLTSRTEGLPNTVLEAMAIGLPIAATRVGAVPDVLAQGDCGVLLGDDESLWLEQLLPLVDQPLVRERLLCAAWLRVQSHYDFSQRMRRIESIYDELLGRTAPMQSNYPDRQAA